MQLFGSGRPRKNRGAPFRFIALKCLCGNDARKEGTQMTTTEEHRLYAALRSLKTDEEAAAFLGDLCTPREIDDLSQRLEVAVMLDEGSSYADVSRATGASSTTVSRVSKCLNGQRGGYRLVLERLKAAGTD